MRHHRRSVDRVWPPALEVKLAHIMTDGTPTTRRPYIIPPPPPISHYQGLEQEKEPSFEHSMDPIQETCGGAVESQSTPKVPASVRPMFSVSEKRRNSILGPLSPSVNTEMDRHLFQHENSPPRIEVKYHRHCKSVPQLQRYSSFSGFDSAYMNQKLNSVNTGDVQRFPPPTSAPSLTEIHSHLGDHSTTVIKEEKEEEEEVNEFGMNLFGSQDRRPFAQFQEQLESSAESRYINLNMPPIPKLHHPQPVTDLGGSTLGNMEWAQNEPSALDLDLPLFYRDSRPSISPGTKNPLSAPSSRASSRAPSRTRSPIASSHSPINDIQPSAQESLDEKPNQPGTTPTVHQQQSHLQDLKAGVRFGSPVPPDSPSKSLLGRRQSHTPEVGENEQENAIEGEPPVESCFSPALLDVISNDQGRWRSPTLSALASLSTSPGPNLNPASPPGLSKADWGSTMASFSAPRGWGDSLGRQHSKNAISHEPDLVTDIPLIEVRDEISLQDIWRMEEDERRDRCGSKQDHVSSMKGEQHAHEEARLIREILLRGRRHDS
ncbi:hypothetical protein BGX20_001747 [Mortierella sp. AD010]|nr:hypothetical protein BGX20_001747 [Mortierella sp. AD010]